MSRRPKTLALATALVLLTGAELGLRALDLEVRTERATAGEVRDPVLLLVGSSRTQRALVPRVIEEQLRAAGLERPFVASVHRSAATQVGLHAIYVESVRPHLEGSRLAHGLVGIEVRVSGANDRCLMDNERAHAEAFGAGSAGGRLVEQLRAGELEEAASDLLGRLALVRTRDTLVRPLVRRWQRASGPAATPSATAEGNALRDALRTADVAWAGGEQGWRAFDDARRSDLLFELMRERYEGNYLADYTLGGLQTDFLRRLIRRVREDGLTPFLYVLPVSPMHARFYRGGLRQRFLRQTEALAREEGVPLFDLGPDSGLRNRHFQDTHHLLSAEAPAFSRRFAKAVLPLVREVSGD